jgi:hypothetical protein
VHGGDAGIGELHQSQHHAVVEVIRTVELRGRILGREIAEAIVGGEIAAERAPHVIVRVDEARHHDHVGGIDHLSIARGQIWPDPRDAAVTDEHIRARQGAQRGVDGDHCTVLDQIRSAPRWPGGALREGLSGGAERQAAAQRGSYHQFRQRSASQHGGLRLRCCDQI